MTGKIAPFNLSSTYVVLGDNGDATPIAVSDRFFEDLESNPCIYKPMLKLLHAESEETLFC
jgi:hypothetical protein